MDADALLSPSFRLSELTRSQVATRHGLLNRPSAEQIQNLTRLCQTVLQPLRAATGPLIITSGFRSPEVNARVGGSRTSQHLQGLAADVVSPDMSSLTLCQLVLDLHLPFDQLIWEGDWMHVSVAAPGAERRGSVLRAHFDGGRVWYSAGIPGQSHVA